MQTTRDIVLGSVGRIVFSILIFMCGSTLNYISEVPHLVDGFTFFVMDFVGSCLVGLSLVMAIMSIRITIDEFAERKKIRRDKDHPIGIPEIDPSLF